MKTLCILIISVTFFLIAGCSGSNATPPSTTTLQAIETPFPSTNTPVLTKTVTSTPTSIPPLALAQFSAQRVGMGSHGNMVCITYQGNLDDLNEVTLRAKYKQEGVIVERNVKPEAIDGQTCFELVDAMYKIAPIELELVATLPSDYEVELSEDSKSRTYDLGEYQWVPFLIWPFGDSNTDNLVSLPRTGHAEAYDFAPESSQQYPNGVGHPALLPSEGKIITLENGPPGYEHHHNTFSFLLDVGFYYQSGHFMWTVNEGTTYPAGKIMGNLTNETGWAHTHTTLRIPPNWNRTYYEGELKKTASFVDMINPHIQLGGSALECGFFICETLPERIRKAIRSGFFEPHYDWGGGEVLYLPD